MPESRDRISKHVDIAAVFARRRSGIIDALDDEVERCLFGSTPSRVTTAGEATRLGVTRAGGVVRSSLGNARNGSPFVNRNSPSGIARGGRVRPSQSVLSSRYPRNPLRDITATVRAIERRRARSAEKQGQQPGSPFLADQFPLDLPLSDFGASTSCPKLRTPAGNKLPKILLDISYQSDGGSEFLTPQKKLLNSIDTVEKVMREELQKLKRTSSAKKADREKRVRTLMSMR